MLGMYGRDCQGGRRIEPQAFDKGRAYSSNSTAMTAVYSLTQNESLINPSLPLLGGDYTVDE